MTITRARRIATAAFGSMAAFCLASTTQAQMVAPTAQHRSGPSLAKPKAAASHVPKGSPAGSSPLAAQAAMPSPAQETIGTAGDGDPIARVGDVNVSADEIRAYVAALGAREQAALANNPSLLSQAVRQMLAGQLLLQEVHAKKWDQRADVTAKLEKVRDNAVAELYLESVSAPPKNFPSEEDLQKVYDANREAFLMPRQFELAQIFVASPKGADKATDDKAKADVTQIARRLKTQAADFSAIAGETGTPNGGNLGWLPETQIVPDIRNQIQGLAKGAVSDPIRLDDGWHIIKFIDTKASYTRTLPEVRDQLVLQIRGERRKALRQAYLAELLKKNPPAINELALSKILTDPNR